jgi:hypothetical protein
MSVVPLPDRCFMVSAVMSKRDALHMKCFQYFKEYSVTEQSLSYPSEKFKETVGSAMESMVAEVAHLNSVEQHITAAIKNSTDFEWIRCTDCSLYHQQIIHGIVRSHENLYSLVV